MKIAQYTVGALLKTIASLLSDGSLDVNASVSVGDYEGNLGDAYRLRVLADGKTKGLRIEIDPNEGV